MKLMRPRKFLIGTMAGIFLSAGPGALAADTAGDALTGTCFAVPSPVVRLSHGSRYEGSGTERATLDPDTDALVRMALAPIDALIRDLAEAANRARAGSEMDAECVIEALNRWAAADALSELQTANAQLSAPARVAGFALAYLQVAPTARARDQERARRIETWLEERARASATWFETEAGPRSARNNLRAWAGLAAAAAGRATETPALLEWASQAFRVVACAADADGALPREMERGPRALQYQLHAVAPLVTTAAILEPAGYDLFGACGGAIHRVVDFTARSLVARGAVAGRAGAEQSLLNGEDALEAHDLAWVETYVARFPSPELDRLTRPFDTLAHSKLGGVQRGLW